MRPIANPEFDPNLPVQTRKGAAQALRVSHNRIDQLIRDGVLVAAWIRDAIRSVESAA